MCFCASLAATCVVSTPSLVQQLVLAPFPPVLGHFLRLTRHLTKNHCVVSTARRRPERGQICKSDIAAYGAEQLTRGESLRRLTKRETLSKALQIILSIQPPLRLN